MVPVSVQARATSPHRSSRSPTDLHKAITDGNLKPGDQLPALPAIESDYEVSTGTARSAINLLRESGLIVTRHGKGSIVRTRQAEQPVGDGAALDALGRTVDDLARRLAEVERRLAER